VAAEVTVFGGSISAPIRVVPSRPVDLTVRVDPGGYVSIQVGSRHILSSFAAATDATPQLGNAGRPDLPALAGTASFLPVPTPVCDRLVRIEHQSASRGQVLDPSAAAPVTGPRATGSEP
jgi:hypothetical protein